MTGARAATGGHRLDEPAQQDVDIRCLNLNVEKLIESSGFRLTNLIIRVIQREDGAETELLASPRILGIDHIVDDLIANLQCAGDVARCNIQPGETPAGRVNRFEEPGKRLPP